MSVWKLTHYTDTFTTDYLHSYTQYFFTGPIFERIMTFILDFDYNNIVFLQRSLSAPQGHAGESWSTSVSADDNRDCYTSRSDVDNNEKKSVDRLFIEAGLLTVNRVIARNSGWLPGKESNPI